MNSGAWQQAVVTESRELATNSVYVGRTFHGALLEVAVTDVELDHATFEGLRLYVVKRYGLDL